MWQPLSHLVPSNVGALANYQQPGVVTSPGFPVGPVPGGRMGRGADSLGGRGHQRGPMGPPQWLPYLPQMQQDAFNTGGMASLAQSLAANPGALSGFGPGNSMNSPFGLAGHYPQRMLMHQLNRLGAMGG